MRTAGVPLLCLLSLLVLDGCSSSRHGGWGRSSQEWLDLALDGQTPEDRRAGIIGLAKSRQATENWVLDVFDTVARTDSDALVRCAAVRAMWRAPDAGRAPTLLKILRSPRGVEDTRPAPGSVRWEAAKLLAAIVENGGYSEPLASEILETSLDCLDKDKDRNVRLMMVEIVGYFPRQPVLTALIAALEEDDFAIKHAAERSLIVLTGTTHEHDPTAWRQWLASTDDPFKNTGAMSPDDIEPKKKRWWQYGWEW